MARLLIRTAKDRLSLTVAKECSVREALDATDLRVRAACGGIGTCGACSVRLAAGVANPPTLAERQKLTAAELAEGWRLACQLHLEGDTEIELEEPAPPSRWKSIPMEDQPPAQAMPRSTDRHAYGVAVDLGTTHIRVALWDRRRGKRIATRWGPNPQGTWGADVLNRLSAAQADPHRARELANLARGAILQAIRDMLARDTGEMEALLPEIGRLAVVGNTAMLALLTGHGAEALLNPENWERAIDCSPPDHAAWRTRWSLPNVECLLPPPLAGFVGSDLLASILAARLREGPPGSMLLDLGTNTELALWDGTVLHVSSVPGGPAFEGAGISFGMAAEPGAISHVAIQPDTPGFSCSTLGGLPPRGFCGSGLISGIAALRETGILKQSGRFAIPVEPGGFVLAPAFSRSAITASDIDTFQRAKAATASAMEELLAQAGLGWGSIHRLCVCGAFGKHLDIAQAQAVGLLPVIEGASIELLPNAALAGCEWGLFAPDMQAMFAHVAANVKVINLSCAPGWGDRYISHLRLAPIHALLGHGRPHEHRNPHPGI